MNQYDNDKVMKDAAKLEIHENLLSRGISTDGLTENELYFLHHMADYFNHENFFTVKDFIHYMDKNQIENKDVTSYSKIDDLRSAITLASMKELTKELEGQVIKEYEDDKWLVVRPLTFQSSSKYGASTRWCTTYQKEKQYFEKYWQYGILVYFINKTTGYKFAGYKSLKDGNELSFWNAEDQRIDYLYVEADEYLFPIVKKILNSDKTNKELCSTEIQNQVMLECEYNIRKMSLSEPTYNGPMVEEGLIMTQRVTRNMFDETMERMGLEISEEVDEARTYHNTNLQGVQNIIVDDINEFGYDERPMRA
jgi:hypothetical protein